MMCGPDGAREVSESGATKGILQVYPMLPSDGEQDRKTDVLLA